MAQTTGTKKALGAFRNSIPANDNLEIYVTEKPVVIESFDWGHISKQGLSVLLYNYDDDMSSNYNGNIFASTRAIARGFSSPQNIINNGSAYFEPRVFDEVSKVFTFKLSQHIVMPNGARLLFRNHTAENIENTWHLVVRELD